MVLPRVVSYFGTSSGISYCFGYWAFSEEVAHLGKNIGHIVYTLSRCQRLFRMKMSNVQLRHLSIEMQLRSKTYMRSKCDAAEDSRNVTCEAYG